MSSVNASPRLGVEDDDARHARQADEEVVLAALVVVEAADHPGRENETFVWRARSGSQLSRQSSMNQPRSSSKRRAGSADAVDHGVGAVLRTKSLTA